MPDIYTAILTDARTLGPHVREVTLTPDALETVPAPLPGQWLSLRLPVGDRPPLIRAYSLAAVPQNGELTICFDRVEDGQGSSYLWEAPIGTTIEFSGPLGNFTLPDTTQGLLFLARFTGIVPFRAMLQALDKIPRRVHLLYEAENLSDLAYHDELLALAESRPWFEYHVGANGTVLATLATNAQSWMPFVPLVCGVREFTLPVRNWLMENLGFERKTVRVENYNGPSGR